MKRCALCGTEFKPHRPYQKYCGRECYMEAGRRRSRKGIIPNPKKCEICGTEFKPHRPYQKYCGRECYMEAERRRSRKGIIPNPKKCAICGTEFKPYRPNHRYCSRSCQHENDRRRAAARRAKDRAAINLQAKFYNLGKRISIARARQLVSEE